MASLWIILKAIPSFLTLITELIKLFKGAMRQNPEQFIEDSHKVIQDLKRAKSAEDKKDAAKKIGDLLNRL